ncbi:hypothetical protein C440_14994 [Haloferax mucosum ATCC BAA-1512]|uniref:Transporter n=1 Tax=Haloferax mucosum ATCC BAA-1512 TaxID=662479 RepID=M0I4F7_9EURY|nr:hypothetical protein [Haloferax mucosum]ELZ91631.1 hypothetical protein C440_14994 [Haloferax mucosum ATCC BAA-1512]
MRNFDLMKAGIGLAVVIGLALTAVAGYALLTTFGGIDGLTVAPELFVSVLFGGILVVSAAAIRKVAPKPRTRI